MLLLLSEKFLSLALAVWVIRDCQVWFFFSFRYKNPASEKTFLVCLSFRNRKHQKCIFVALFFFSQMGFLRFFLQHFSFEFWSRNFTLRHFNFAIDLKNYFWWHLNFADFRSQLQNRGNLMARKFFVFK